MFNIEDIRQRDSVLSMLRALQKQNKVLLNAKDYSPRINNSKKQHKSIKGFLLNQYSQFMIKIMVKSNIVNNEQETEYADEEFFSDKKIAVYTSIFGNYEQIIEPEIKPDNVDYYIITDCSVKPNSRWKKIDFDFPSGLNASQKNRYVKMHPHLLFPEYRYSIYVDGSAYILSDLTPLIHRINKYGFAMHMHSARNDLYDEMLVAKYTKRISSHCYNDYLEFLKNENMPRHFGLVECGIIARDHENLLCKKIMEEWWNQYLTRINRDQICLAYVLYKNNIAPKDIGTLGLNIFKSALYKFVGHK